MSQYGINVVNRNEYKISSRRFGKVPFNITPSSDGFGVYIYNTTNIVTRMLLSISANAIPLIKGKTTTIDTGTLGADGSSFLDYGGYQSEKWADMTIFEKLNNEKDSYGIVIDGKKNPLSSISLTPIERTFQLTLNGTGRFDAYNHKVSVPLPDTTKGVFTFSYDILKNDRYNSIGLNTKIVPTTNSYDIYISDSYYYSDAPNGVMRSGVGNVNIQIKFQLSIFGLAITNNKKYGIQTFDENGKLLFDSRTALSLIDLGTVSGSSIFYSPDYVGKKEPKIPEGYEMLFSFIEESNEKLNTMTLHYIGVSKS